MNKHQAIYDNYPSVVSVRGDVAYDKDENIIQYEEELVQSYIDAKSYKSQRELEYPPLTDLADAMYWASQGDNTKLDNYYAACEAVKLKYPKS